MTKNNTDAGYHKPVRANDDDSTTTFTAESDFDVTKPNSDGGPEVTPPRHLMEEELLGTRTTAKSSETTTSTDTAPRSAPMPSGKASK